VEPEREDKVMAVLSAWNRGDFDAFFDWLAEDVEFVMDPSWPERGPLRGEEVVGFMRGWIDSWDRLELIVHEVESTDATVVMRCTWKVRGHASGADVTHDLSLVYELDDELRLRRLHALFDHERALEVARAVG